MAERRMFAKTIVDSDAFLDMPLSAQALYFQLSMRADDEGFVGNPKKIVGMLGATKTDFRMLVKREFIVLFDSGVVFVKHWKTHNYIPASRIKPTAYQREKRTLFENEKCVQVADNLHTDCIQNADNLSEQVSIEKDSIGECSKEEDSKGENRVNLLAKEIKNRSDITRVYERKFKLDLCDLIIDSLAEQAYSVKLFRGHKANAFLEFAKNDFDDYVLVRLVNKLLAAKDVEDKKNYILAIICEEYLS